MLILHNSFENNIHCWGLFTSFHMKLQLNSFNFEGNLPALLSVCPFLSSYHPHASVTVGPPSHPRAVNVTRFGLLFLLWVGVVLFFVAPLITFQLWPIKGKKLKLESTWFLLFTIRHIHVQKNTHTPYWTVTCKTFVKLGTPSRCGASAEPLTSHWRSSSRRRERNPPVGTPTCSESPCPGHNANSYLSR